MTKKSTNVYKDILNHITTALPINANTILIVLSPLIIIIALIGLWQINNIENRLSQEKVNQNLPVLKKAQNPEYFVDVGGAVEKPGVYSITTNMRVVDVLRLAGGLSAQADKYYIARQLNLAKKLADEEKIYIPFLEERTTYTNQINSNTININNASQTELELLPGVGQVTAQKIIQNRPYTTLQDLLTKKIVRESIFNKIKELIIL